MRLVASLLAVALLLVGLSAYAAAPRVISFQGKLTDPIGVPMAGTYPMTFRLWDAETGGSKLHEQMFSAVVVDDEGLYNVELDIPTSVTFSFEVWLGVDVANDGEMSPRYRLTTSPYAFYSVDSDMLDGKHADEFLGGSGTSNYIAMFVGTYEVGNSQIYQNGNNIGIGTATASNKLEVSGTLRSTEKAALGPGCANTGTDAFSAGSNCVASGSRSTVSGGYNNTATSTYATVGGGYSNDATYSYTTIGGGYQNYAYRTAATVAGGYYNQATYYYASVGGGNRNTASGYYSRVGGGYYNRATYYYASVGGGYRNTASGYYSRVGGGYYNYATNYYTFVGGGYRNTASGSRAGIASGYYGYASGSYSSIGGGYQNDATASYSRVGGGYYNYATGSYSCVPGGYRNTARGSYSFAANRYSYVPSNRSNSAAFNGQTATASSQTRVAIISKSAGSFTIDHPLDPDNKILNHYFAESPEMVLIYRGVARIGSDGRAEVHLPDYFDALNRNPMVQLTGVGTSDVYVSEEVAGNSFVIGGKPGTKVFWTVTGDRKDQSAEIARTIMPVEQVKDGELVGRSLDDELLVATRAQLEEMGEAGRFQFRTQAARERYQESLREPAEPVEEPIEEPVEEPVEE